MKTYARIANGAVAEVVSLSDDLTPGKDVFTSDFAETLVSCDATVQPGWTYDGKAFAAPATTAPVPVVPASISRRQFFQQLAIQSVITQDEALAAVSTGAIPAAMQTLISALPATAQFAAKMSVIGATAFYRADPLTAQLGAAEGWTPAQVDEVWIAGAAL